MAKKIFIGCATLIFLFFVSPSKISAQVRKESYFCCYHTPCIHFNSAEALNRHNCQYHPSLCKDIEPGKKTAFATPIGGLVVGGLIGGAVGSALKDKNGKSEIVTGAIVGGVGGGLIGVVIGAKRTKGDFVIHIRKTRFFTNMAIITPGNGIGIGLYF